MYIGDMCTFVVVTWFSADLPSGTLNPRMLLWMMYAGTPDSRNVTLASLPYNNIQV